MSTWLQLLPLELSGIDELVEPSYPVEENECQVGIMSNMSRRLFTLGQALEKEANQANLDAKYCIDKVKKAELQSKAHEFMIKANVIKELMLIDIKDDYGLWSEHVGVRMGFKVVTISVNKDNMPPAR